MTKISFLRFSRYICPVFFRFQLWLFLTTLAGLVASAKAEVSAPMFQDNLVLQQEMAVPIFGRATPGETVTVLFCGQTRTTQADAQGQWLVKLAPLKAGGPWVMTIQGQNTLTCSNVLVGEVWLCAGQSNMGYSMKKIGGANTNNAAQANFPNIRICTMARGQRGKWETVTPEVCLRSSATAYYFGTNLYSTLNVPIGLIVSSSPGTSIRYWVDPETIAGDKNLAGQKSAGKWYNELVKPVIPYGLRGAIWYQGESDTDGQPQEYQFRFQSLINHYRKNWGQGDFPFIYMQLASFGEKQTNAGGASGWAEIRNAQAQTLALTNTAMAVSIDIGTLDYHPENKWDVGKRLALPALRRVYGYTNISDESGPVLQSSEKNNGTVYLHFNHTSGGLVDKGQNQLLGFAVCGTDNQWHWAKGSIQQNTVVLTCAEVKDPVRVRYAWADCPIATPLYNGAGLPAVPFEAKVKP